MSSRLLLVAACFALAESANYCYDRTAQNGPYYWASLSGSNCGGRQQTPIDLCGGVPFPPRPGRREDHDDHDDDDKKPSYGYTLNGYNQKTELTIRNPGNSILMSVSGAAPKVSAPGLHQLVGRNPSDTVSNPEWEFAQMHIHWGRNPNEGSEHALAGLRYAAEAHFVHFNKARGKTINEAVASGKNDALLVIGAFLAQGPADKESELVRVLSSYVPKLQSAPQKTIKMSEKLVLGDLIKPEGTFYSYGGGLTTPGCVEIVTWIVQSKPFIISVESLDLIREAIDADTGLPIATYGNFRPLLPLNGRTLYVSSGVSPKCHTYEDPDSFHECEGAGTALKSASSSDASPAETTSSSTPAWVWVVIGVAIPGTALVAVLGTLYYASWRQRQVSADENVVFTPLPELREVQPANSMDLEAVRK